MNSGFKRLFLMMICICSVSAAHARDGYRVSDNGDSLIVFGSAVKALRNALSASQLRTDVFNCTSTVTENGQPACRFDLRKQVNRYTASMVNPSYVGNRSGMRSQVNLMGEGARKIFESLDVTPSESASYARLDIRRIKVLRESGTDYVECQEYESNYNRREYLYSCAIVLY